MKNSNKKRILIIGAYGCGNAGDDALLQSIVDYFHDYNLTATAGSKNNLKPWLQVKTIRCRLNEGISFPVFKSMIKDVFIILFHLIHSNAIIFGGGSLIHDLTFYNLIFIYFWHLCALIFRKRVYYLGMGVGPLNTRFGKKISKFFLSKSTYLFVRDKRGESICHSIDVNNSILSNDIAFLINKKNQCNGRTLRENNLHEKCYICITASEWFDSDNFWNKSSIDFEVQIKKFAAYLDMLFEFYNMKIVFVPTVSHDSQLAEKLSNKISFKDYIIIPNNYNSMEMAEIIENSYLLVGMRMHSIIFAARQSVPFIAIIYNQKVNELLEILDLADYSIPINDMNLIALTSAVNKIESNYGIIQKKLKEKSALLREQAIKSMDMIEKDMMT